MANRKTHKEKIEMIRPKFFRKQDAWMLSTAVKIHRIENPGQILKMQDGTIYRVETDGSVKNTSKNRAKFRRLRHAIKNLK